MYLTIIVPAYREGDRLWSTLECLQRYLAAQQYASEVLVVENGEGGESDSRLRRGGGSLVRWIREPRRGKGAAVRRGMLEAVGRFRFLCDADLAMPVEQIARFLPPLVSGRDLAIGSREIPGARRHHQPMLRRLMGRTFNQFVRWSVLPDFADTQCGFKCFAAAAAEDLFRAQSIDGMSFDVEVLYIARQRNYRIQEVPIDWYHRDGSRVRIVRDSLQMVSDVMRIRHNARAGRYASSGSTGLASEVAPRTSRLAPLGSSAHSRREP